jgi:hypothetical protein
MLTIAGDGRFSDDLDENISSLSPEVNNPKQERVFIPSKKLFSETSLGIL